MCPIEGETRTSVKIGSPVLEGILNGELPSASSIALIGAPGAGTTMMSIQFIVNALAKGKKVTFVLLDYVPQLAKKYFNSFGFDPEPFIADGRLQIIDTYTLLCSSLGISMMTDIENLRPIEFPEASQFFEKNLWSKIPNNEPEPSSVVADSFTSFSPFFDIHTLYEILVEGFARIREGRHPSLVVAHEGVLEGNFVQPLTRFVDGVIRLKTEWSGQGYTRELFIEKLRFTNVETPSVEFTITSQGLKLLYERSQRSAETSPHLTHTRVAKKESIKLPREGRISTGMPALDSLLEGGFPKGTFICVEGDVGTGTSTFCAQFAWSQLLAGGKVAYYCIDDPPDTVINQFRSYGWDITPSIEKGSMILADAFSLFRTGQTTLAKGSKQIEATRKAISKFIQEEDEKIGVSVVGDRPLVVVIDSFTTLSPYLDLKTAYVLARIVADNARRSDETYLTVVRSGAVEANLLYACLGTADGLLRLDNTWIKEKTTHGSGRRLVRKIRVEKMSFTPMPRNALEYEISPKGMKLTDSG